MPEPTTPREIAAWLKSYRNRSVRDFAWDVLRGLKLYRPQVAMGDAVDAHPRVAVRKARGVGGSFAAAVIFLKFLVTRPCSRVLITGPQFENSVVNNLIPKVHALLTRSPLLTSMFQVTTAAVVARSDALKRSWNAIGVASETPQYVEFAHSLSLLWVIDESAFVQRQVFLSAIGGLTEGPDNRILLLGTPPLAKVGFFHSCFEGEAGDWHCLTIPATDAVQPDGPIAPERIAEARRTLGEQSPEFASQILAVPADQRRETLIPMSHYHAAVRRHPLFTGDRQGDTPLPCHPFLSERDRLTLRRNGDSDDPGLVVLALDPSGGGDEAIVAVRWGAWLMALHKLDGRSEAAMAAGVTAIVEEWNRHTDRPPVARIIIERGGFGRGCTETLRKQYGSRLVTVLDPSGHPRERTLGNRRAEMWVNLAVLSERGDVALLADERLEQDLAAISRRTADNGRTYVTRKQDLATELGRSPDRGDAVALVFSGYAPGKGDRDAVTTVRFAV